MPLMGNSPIWNANTIRNRIAMQLVGMVFRKSIMGEAMVSSRPPFFHPARRPSPPPSTEESTMAGMVSSSVQRMRNKTVSSTGRLVR